MTMTGEKAVIIRLDLASPNKAPRATPESKVVDEQTNASAMSPDHCRALGASQVLNVTAPTARC